MQVRSIKQSTATLEITAMLCKTITGTNERRGKAKQCTGGGGGKIVYPNSLIDGEKEPFSNLAQNVINILHACILQ